MNPQPTFCPNNDCPSRGIQAQGNIKVHDSLRNRWKCTTCNKTFSGRNGTPFHHLKHNEKTVVLVLTLLAYGCPPQAVVAAFSLDERTVASWQHKAGQHCQAVHEALVEQPRETTLVQTDELRIRCQRRLVLWLAMAICSTTRLWLGGVVSPKRDKHLARKIAQKVKSCCHLGSVLVITDGWTAYREAFLRAFRSPLRLGKRGAPRLIAWSGFVLAQTVKWTEAGRVLGIRICHLSGNRKTVGVLLPSGQVLSTAYIERLNATFRQRMSCLCRRSRCLVRTESHLRAGMYLVGSVYNFCTPHKSLRLEKRSGNSRFVLRSPAMAGGLTERIWTVGELLCYHIAPPPYVAPKRRGRPKGKKPPQEAQGENKVITV